MEAHGLGGSRNSHRWRSSEYYEQIADEAENVLSPNIKVSFILLVFFAQLWEMSLQQVPLPCNFLVLVVVLMILTTDVLLEDEDENIPKRPFNVSDPVIAIEDGPVALQTAAASAQSIGVVSIILGLVSAVMLAYKHCMVVLSFDKV